MKTRSGRSKPSTPGVPRAAGAKSGAPRPRPRVFGFRTGRPGRGGFTLIEILIALGLFAIGASALMALYLQNLNTAKLAREEIILAMLFKDIATKNQLSAYTGNKRFGRAFCPEDWCCDSPPCRTGWEIGHPSDPKQSIEAYNRMVAKDPQNPEPEEKLRLWQNVHMYRGFNFVMDYVYPPKIENDQFVDWDGYGIINEKDVGVDITGDGKVEDIDVDFGPPSPSHGVEYDARKMSNYTRRFKLTIFWELRDPKNFKSGKWEEFYFSVFNPDLAKH